MLKIVYYFSRCNIFPKVFFGVLLTLRFLSLEANESNSPQFIGIGPLPIVLVDSITETTGYYFSHQKHYIPGEPLNKVEKTIYLAINVWQSDEGLNNFPDNDEVRATLNQMSGWLNHVFSRVQAPSDPVEGVTYLTDSYIRFELMDVTFFQRSDMQNVNCSAGKKLNDAAFYEKPANRSYLNLHFTTGHCIGASGYAAFPSPVNQDEDAYVVSFIKEGENFQNYPFWALMLHLAHEIGHVLDLKHPYDSEHCRFSHPDFLFDLFGSQTQPWCESTRQNCDVCFHQGGWDCKYTDPEFHCTNNLMGGTKDPGSITPLQMGRMHRALALKSCRKYTWGYSPEPFIVEGDQTWEINAKFYQDILVKSGTTLQLKGTLEMVSEAFIIIEPGATLLVDSGKITIARNAQQQWQGFIKLRDSKKWYQVFRNIMPEGRVEFINNGTADNYIKGE